ncbi:olfactory receptor 10A7-like [Gastrophryne carolinensis]
MCAENQTRVTHVTFLGFGQPHQMKPVLFVFFLIAFFIAFIGNTLVFVVIIVSPKLHTPMYIFLSHFSLNEILFTSINFPNILYVVWGNGGSVPLGFCLSYFWLYELILESEILFLALMALDRCLAICNPLRYTSLMNVETRNRLVFMTWILGFLIPSAETIFICRLHFCHSNVIDHYVCDLKSILDLSSSNTYLVEIEDLILNIVFGLFPFSLIIASYAAIFITVSRISTMKGRQKAFSTCTSHLISVWMYFGTLCAIYMVPSELYDTKLNKIISLGYTVVTPMANPIIYSLRNQEIKACMISKKSYPAVNFSLWRRNPQPSPLARCRISATKS